MPNMDEFLASKLTGFFSQGNTENSTTNASLSDTSLSTEASAAEYAPTTLAQKAVGAPKTYIVSKPGQNKKDADKMKKQNKTSSISTKSKKIKKSKKQSLPPKLASKADKKTEAKNKTNKAIDKIKAINKKPDKKKAAVVSGTTAAKGRAEESLQAKLNKKKTDDKLAPAKVKKQKQ